MWENGRHLPSDEGVLNDYLLNLSVPSGTRDACVKAWRRASRTDRLALEKPGPPAPQTSDSTAVAEPVSVGVASDTDRRAVERNDCDRGGGVGDKDPVEQSPEPDVGVSPPATNQYDDALRRRRRLLLAVAVLVTIITIVGMFMANRNFSVSQVTINTPHDEATVPGHVVVQGRAQLPRGMQLWLLVQPQTGDPAFFVGTLKPISVDSSGAWLASVTIGRGEQDAGYRFRLLAVDRQSAGA